VEPEDNLGANPEGDLGANPGADPGADPGVNPDGDVQGHPHPERDLEVNPDSDDDIRLRRRPALPRAPRFELTTGLIGTSQQGRHKRDRRVSPILCDSDQSDIQEVNVSDDDDDSEEYGPRLRRPSRSPNGNQRNPTRQGQRTRKPRMPDIDRQKQITLLEYIRDNNEYDRVKGKNLYKEISNNRIIGDYTFETIYGHMKRNLLVRSVFNEVSREMNMDRITKANFEPYLYPG